MTKFVTSELPPEERKGSLTPPFLSSGGSSLVTNFVIVALLLRVSDISARIRGS